jgi:hypothetical protein
MAKRKENVNLRTDNTMAKKKRKKDKHCQGKRAIIKFIENDMSMYIARLLLLKMLDAVTF